MKIPIDKIIIGERQRLELPDLSSLRDSLRELGQINPITVEAMLDGTYHLIAGRCRLESAKLEGWTEIEATTQSGLTETIRQRIELEEDLVREGRSWQDVALSLYKLFHIIRREKALDGVQWSLREMSRFTGWSKAHVHRFMEVAEALKKEPRDEEIWSSSGATEAYRTLIERAATQAAAEKERRRQIENRQRLQEQQQVQQFDGMLKEIMTLPKETGIAGEPSPSMPSAPPPSAVPLRDETLAQEEAPEVIIHGWNRTFDPAPWIEDEAKFYAIIGFDFTLLQPLLRPEGVAITFHDIVSFREIWGEEPNALPLIWDTLRQDEEVFQHFDPTYMMGLVQLAERPLAVKPRLAPSAVLQAYQDHPGYFPASVVTWLLENICPPNMVVLCINGANPVAVAQTGRIPYFFEPDKTAFDKMVKDLTAFYEENVPGVKVRMTTR